MANEVAIDKRRFTMLLHIETIKKAQARFGRTGDISFREAIVRALEEITRDVQLTPKQVREIAEEVEANYKAREAAREANRIKKGTK
jgi:phosphopantothenate synthetase